MATRAAPILLLLLALPVAARAQDAEPPGPAPQAEAAPPPGVPLLRLDLPTAAWVTGGELALVLASEALRPQLLPPACRWCTPTQVDTWARRELAWEDAWAAQAMSNDFQLLIPLGAAAALWAMASPYGNRQVAEDLLVVAESATTTMLLTQVSKFGFARLRPYAYPNTGAAPPYDIMSFWSGHTSFVFAVAAASTQVARLRGYGGWKWLAAIGFAAAAVTGYFRIAADEHWLTDVLAGAAVGTTVGLVVPLLVLRPADGKRPAAVLVPAPGGLAVLF